MKIQKLHESVEEAQAYATLLTIDEARKLPERLRKHNDWWWLRSPGYFHGYIAFVSSAGNVLYNGSYVSDNRGAVRPALKIQNLDQPIGTKFRFGGKTFEVIDDETALCLGDIGKYYFNKTEEQGNDYETSDIKKYVDDWFEQAWKDLQ